MRNPFITDLHFVAGVSRVFKLLNFEIPEGGFGFECFGKHYTLVWFCRNLLLTKEHLRLFHEFLVIMSNCVVFLPATLEKLTTRPLAFFTKGIKYLVTSIIPHKLTSAMRLKMSSGAHSIGQMLIIPALFTRPHNPVIWVEETDMKLYRNSADLQYDLVERWIRLVGCITACLKQVTVSACLTLWSKFKFLEFSMLQHIFSTV